MPDHGLAWRGLALLPLLTLAACTAPTRPEAPAPATTPAPSETAAPSKPAAPAPEPAGDDAVVATEPLAESSPASDLWSEITSRHGFVDCEDPPPAVRRWERIYAQSPKRHAEAMATASPWIAYVADELARRDLPAEYVWLPFVESRYHAFRTRGERPAGAWQMMPATARWRGLRIADDYDGRLDFVAATDAALDLIEHLATVFDRDWSLVTMAYNAGEYRIKGALARARKSGQSTRPEHLAVSPITHEHLVKLRALACITRHPQRVGLTLPTVDVTQELRPAIVPKAMNVSQLAALSGVGESQWLLWNPAWRRGHVDAGATILLPRALIERSVEAIARATPEPIERRAVETIGNGERVHVVRSGESAWSIARRHRVSLSALLAANGLGKASVLRPGQKLRLP